MGEDTDELDEVAEGLDEEKGDRRQEIGLMYES